MKLKKQPIVVISENNGIINLHTTGAIMAESTAEDFDYGSMGRFMIYRKDLKTALKHVRDFGAIGSIQLYAKNQDGEISGPEQQILNRYSGDIQAAMRYCIRVSLQFPQLKQEYNKYAEELAKIGEK